MYKTEEHLRVFTFTSFLLFFSFSLKGQSPHNSRGIYFSFFDQEIGNVSLDKEYLNRSYALGIAQKTKIATLSFAAITFDFKTQLGVTNVSETRSTITEKGIEVSVLLGLNLEFSFLPRTWWLYVGGSVGPQFISNAPKRQNHGFIFSDSIYFGNRFLINKRKQIDFRGGFRHQSNAGFSNPNGGINSVYVSVGLFSTI